MRKNLTPFKNRKLAATKNVLRTSSTDNKHVSVSGASINFGADFTISCLLAFDAVTNDKIGLTIQNSSNQGFIFGLTSTNELFQATSDDDTLFTSTNANSNLRVDQINRFTLIRKDDDLKFYLNDRKVYTTSVAGKSFNLGSITNFRIGGFDGSTSGFDGLVGNLIILQDRAFTDRELTSFHLTNVIPKSVHAYVLAHYPFNQRAGIKAWDTVEQYNYAKVTPVNRINGDLINYSNDEAGVTNPLIQTVWNNFYSKRKDNDSYLKLDGAGQYLTIPSFSNQTFNQWTMMFVLDTKGLLSGPQAFFGNKLVDPSLYFRFNTTSLQVEIFLDAGALNRLATLSYVQGNSVKFLVWTDGVTSRLYPEGPSFENGYFFSLPESAFTQNDFVNFFFGYNHYFGSTYAGGLGKLVMLDKAANLDERLALFNADQNTLYKKFPRVLDLDFSDVFLDSGDYYARDNSGNNRHAQLNTFSPSLDQPLKEQSTRLPLKTKALKFNGTNQYLAIDSFTPTKEKGYTTIIGMCLDSDRLFDAGYGDTFISKRDSANGKLRIIFGFAGTKTVHSTQTGSGFFSGPMVVMNTDTSKPHFISIVEKTNDSMVFPDGKAFMDGNITRTDINGFDTPQDYSEIDGSLCIGRDDGESRYLNGYVFFIGIWKGFLSDEQIHNISNNTLGANVNQSLMAECQLYLNFEEIIDDSGTYKIKDWSPQDRAVILNNYSSAEITPGDPLYRLIDIDTLR